MKPLEKINLTEEITLRARLRAEFDRLSRIGLAPVSESDLSALAELLSEVIETRKQAEKQEKELKAELKRHFKEGAETLDCGAIIALLDHRARTDLDREALIKDFGQSVIERYMKKTTYETLTLKRKGG